MLGLSELSGSWKTICTPRRSSRVRSRDVVPSGVAVEQDVAGAGRVEPRDAARERRLAAAALADHGKAAAGRELERHVVDGDQRRLRAATPAHAAAVARDEVAHHEAHVIAGSGGRLAARLAQRDGLGTRVLVDVGQSRAAHERPLRRADKRGALAAARLDREIAAVGEDAAVRAIPRLDRRARDADGPDRPAAHARDGLEQPARVRVPRMAEELVGRALLDHAAAVHDDHAVGEPAHDAEVVADVDDRGVTAAQLGDDLEQARLRDHVEPGRRLVHHDQVGLAREGDRDRDALLLAAGELMRVAAQERRIGG